MNVLITGASGLIGLALSQYLVNKGHDVIKIGRTKRAPTDLLWDPPKGIIQLPEGVNIDGMIHLAGENIAQGRWTAKKKERIRSSRIDSTDLLVRTITSLDTKPKVMLSASGIGIYGDQEDRIITEEADLSGKGFLIDVCREWEAATRPAENAGVRVVHMRIAPVLTTSGGILKKMLPLFNIGLGATLGSGLQYMSWIVIEDVLRAVEFLLEEESIEGPVNFCTSNPVTNLDMTKTLGRVLGRPTVFRIPGKILGILFGELANEELLSSTRAVPEKLMASGFKFRYPLLEDGLNYLLKQHD